MAKIILEGQRFDLPDILVVDDETLKRTLTPYYPDVANATVNRQQKEGYLEITVAKRPGAKGNQAVLNALEQAPRQLNAAVEIFFQVRDLGIEDILAQMERINAAIKEGEQDMRSVMGAMEQLGHAPATMGRLVPIGF